MTLTAEEAREVVDYDPDTGTFRWRKNGANKRVAGSIAGTPTNQHGRVYIVMNIGSRMYRAHRIAWLLMYGRWPVGDVDHKNGDTRDNRIANLRECSRSENICNSKRSTRNTSGVKGVHWDKRDQRWVATITKRGRVHHLGHFKDKAEAAAARSRAALEIHGEFARPG